MNPDPPWTHEYAAENSSQTLVDICIAFAILETLFVIAFIFSWHFNKDNNCSNTRGVYALILLGYIFCFGGVILGILKFKIGGAGEHAQTLHPEMVRRMLQLIKAHEVVYVLSIPFPKLAILLLYLRVFTTKLSTSILYATGLIIIATLLFGLISAFSNCRPFHAFWDRNVSMECTMDIVTALRFYSVPNITVDVIMLTIPVPALYKLNVSALAKFGVAFTFLVSTLGTVTAVLRFVTFLNTNMFEDVTYNAISTTCWSIVEPGVYLMAATVPTLRPLVRRLVSGKQPDPVLRLATPRLQFVTQGTVPATPVIERPHLTKSSTKDVVQTIGHQPSRALRLDDYHYIRYGSGVFSVRTDDEESMVCADAVVHEAMGRQGRNPDGSLQVWSLQPMQFSPLRTSFFLSQDERLV